MLGIKREITRAKNSALALVLLLTLVLSVANPTLVHAQMQNEPVADFPVVAGSVPEFGVYALASAADGSIYVGGRFTTVGGETRNGLAKILPDKTIDPDFNPNIDGGIDALFLDEVSSTLYVGGEFGTVNGGTTRNNVAAFNTTTGTATAFNPNVNGTVSAMVVDYTDEVLYIGGQFSSVNGATSRTWLAGLDATTGVATDLNADNSLGINGEGLWVVSLAYDEVDRILYAGGGAYFANDDGYRQALAAIDIDTGTYNSFDPGFSSATIYGITLSADRRTVYAAGNFSELGDPVRDSLASFNASDGSLTDFTPTIPQHDDHYLSIFALDLNADGTLLAGGRYYDFGNSYIGYLAAFEDPDQDNDGTTNAAEAAGPNGGDGNNDGTPDAQQANVTSLLNEDTDEFVTVVSPEGTNLTATSSESAPGESGYSHLFGLTGFTVTGVTPGDTITMSVFYPNPDGYAADDLNARKYFPSTGTYQDLEGASISSVTIDSQSTLELTFSLTDGGFYDIDETANGEITDPVSLARADDATLADTGDSSVMSVLGAVILLALAGISFRRYAARNS